MKEKYFLAKVSGTNGFLLLFAFCFTSGNAHATSLKYICTLRIALREPCKTWNVLKIEVK